MVMDPKRAASVLSYRAAVPYMPPHLTKDQPDAQ